VRSSPTARLAVQVAAVVELADQVLHFLVTRVYRVKGIWVAIVCWLPTCTPLVVAVVPGLLA
jgi:hypothetical protein